MAWIESHQTLWEHAKTRKAARKLGIEPVHLVGHLHSLWHWALDHAEDGDLSKYDAEDLAIAARWSGDPDEFVAALTDCGPGDSAGFFERDGSCGPPEDGRTAAVVLHDWWDYAGKLIARRIKDRARKSAARSTGGPQDSPEDVQGKSDGKAQDGPVDSRYTRTEPDPTQPTNQPEPTTSADEVEASDDARRLTALFAELVAANRHKAPTPGTRNYDGWLVEIDRLLRIDKATPGEVEQVMRWCAADRGNDRYPGEAVNVRSAKKLRERFGQLLGKSQASNVRQLPRVQHVSDFSSVESGAFRP